MIEATYDDERRFVFVTLRGELTREEAEAWFLGFLTRVRAMTCVSGLIDTTGIEVVELPSETVRKLSEWAARGDRAFAGSRWAIVATTDLVFGLARMYQLLRADCGYELRVFRRVGEARDWLKLDPEA